MSAPLELRRAFAVWGLLMLALPLCGASAGRAPGRAPGPAAGKIAASRAVPAPVTAAELGAALTPRTRPLLVHVWASWCVPCRAEWPRLADALRRARGVDVLTLAVDSDETRPAAVRLFATLGDVPGRALAAPGADAYPAVRRLDPEWDGALPSTYLLGPDGHLLLAQRGATRLRALEEAIAALAKRTASRRSTAPPTLERRQT